MTMVPGVRSELVINIGVFSHGITSETRVDSITSDVRVAFLITLDGRVHDIFDVVRSVTIFNSPLWLVGITLINRSGTDIFVVKHVSTAVPDA